MIACGQSIPTRLSASAGRDGRSPESSAAGSLAGEIFSIALAGNAWRRASTEVAFAIGVHTIRWTASLDRARLPPITCPEAVWTVTPSNDTGGIARYPTATAVYMAAITHGSGDRRRDARGCEAFVRTKIRPQVEMIAPVITSNPTGGEDSSASAATRTQEAMWARGCASSGPNVVRIRWTARNAITLAGTTAHQADWNPATI